MAPMPSKQQVMPIDPTQVVRDPARLAALRRTALLDTASEAAFDRLTRLVMIILNVPVALVSLVDEDRQFFKSCVGLPEPWASRRETPLSHSFCQHTITSNEPLLIADARVHPLVSDNLAIPDLNVIAYAGIPLILPDGSAIGSLCAIDTHPRWWTADEVNILRDLALSAVTEVELRIATLEAKALADEAERERWEKLALLESTGEGIFGVDLDGRSDLYSLGVVGYQIACGDLPFNAPNTPSMLVKHLSEMPTPVEQRQPDLPTDLARVIMMLLEKDPANRFPDAQSVVAALSSGVFTDEEMMKQEAWETVFKNIYGKTTTIYKVSVLLERSR